MVEHTIANDLDAVAEVARLAFDLDAVVKVLLKGSAVEDTVGSRLRVIDDELVLSSSGLAGGGLGSLCHAEQSNADVDEAEQSRQGENRDKPDQPTEKRAQQSMIGY
jgi:hypothetical protein